MIFLAPVNGWVFSVVSKMRRKVLKYSDLRVKMMNEILTGIGILKFYAWERPFGEEVGVLRQKELDALTKLAYVTAVGFSIILLSTPIIQPIIVFVTYVNIQDEPLTASTAFTTVALFNIMRFPFAFMPMGLLQFIQSRISMQRLKRYLSLPELNKYVAPQAPPPSDGVDNNTNASLSQSGSITILNGSFGWNDPDAAPVRPVQDEPKKKKKKKKKDRKKKGDDDASSAGGSFSADLARSSSLRSIPTSVATKDGGKCITLQDISVQIPAGSLVACVGSVGSGKSSFLSSILGEMEPIAGSKVYMPSANKQSHGLGFVSYCTQSPWVVNDTLKSNILFGREFDEERYQKVIHACALVDDLAVLPAGDQTEIGERGINLSGGQKARVALARAVSSADTHILLMDDPLSAVDAHVGDYLFANAITGSVSQGMTRILVTHHVHVLPKCDYIVVMEHGRISHQGTFNELIVQGVDFTGAVDIFKLKKQEKKATKELN